ncbi:MAG: GNAT family N-acetyltransferase [Hyphomicrobiales bacterium]
MSAAEVTAPDDAARYVAAVQALGVPALLRNLETSISLHRWGTCDVPLTRNDGDTANTFVCSPHVGLIRYPREELAHFPDARLAHLLRLVLAAAGLVAAPAQLNRIVTINNWLLTTNPPRARDPHLADAQTAELVARYPHHMLALRSLTRRQQAPLMQALENRGWLMMPARQVYFMEDAAQALRMRRDCLRDEKAFRQTPLRFDVLKTMTAEDAARIAALYRQLYLEKHSTLNPDYTAAFVQMAHDTGLLAFHVFRDSAGLIQCFAALSQTDDSLTAPLMGYDTAAPQALNFYRLAFHAITRHAAAQGLLLNMSSGAAGFKRNRGAVPEMEFTALYVRHLPALRRLSTTLLQRAAMAIAVPLLQKYGL